MNRTALWVLVAATATAHITTVQSAMAQSGNKKKKNIFENIADGAKKAAGNVGKGVDRMVNGKKGRKRKSGNAQAMKIFDHRRASRFSWENAYVAGLASLWIYDGETCRNGPRQPKKRPSTARAATKVFGRKFKACLGLEKLRFFIGERKADTQAAIAENDKAIFVVFRGTSSFGDFLTDVNFPTSAEPKLGAKVRIHNGFRNALRQVMPRMIQDLKRRQKRGPKKAIIVTGHSLGGALAHLASAHFHKAGVRPDAVYTFGACHVGKGAWPKVYDRRLGKQTFRFVNKADPIPHFPHFAQGYRQVGQLRWFDNNGKLKRSMPPTLIRRWGQFPGDDAHHSMREYIRLMHDGSPKSKRRKLASVRFECGKKRPHCRGK